MVVPTPSDNLSIRAYPGVNQIGLIDEVIQYQDEYLTDLDAYNTAKKSAEESGDQAAVDALIIPEYKFHPTLFGVVDLDPKPGFASLSAFVMLLFALGSAFTQYWISRQQLPSKKSQKSKTFRQLMREAADGQEPDQAELSQAMTGQMSFIMPLMMFMIMINLPGAIVFYYCISNILTGLQQKYLLDKKTDEMEVSADKRLIKELKNIEEAQVVSDPAKDGRWVKNKNSKNAGGSGVHITRISAGKGTKKKRS